MEELYLKTHEMQKRFEVENKVKELKGLEVKKLTGSRVKELMRKNIVCIVFSHQLINS